MTSENAQYILNVIAQQGSGGMTQKEACGDLNDFGNSIGCDSSTSRELEDIFNEALITGEIKEKDGKYYATGSYEWKESFFAKH